MQANFLIHNIRSIVLLVLTMAFVPIAHADDAAAWTNPIQKQGYLDSPLVETTPISFQGELYLLECWRSKWEWQDGPDPSVREQAEIWMAHLPEGPGKYAQRDYLGRVLEGCTLGTALVWEDRVYVYAVIAGHSSGGQVVMMTSTEDMKTWTKPVKVFDSPSGKIFNIAVTRDAEGKLAFLWETDSKDYGQVAFTMCYGRVDGPTKNWNSGIIDGAIYGPDKYTGGPALYFEKGWFYTLYLEDITGGWETRIARSRDLKRWQDAPTGRTFLSPDSKRTGIPLRPADVQENNASDPELCYHDGRTLIYFTGSDQQVAGDLQWASFEGKPSELFESFFQGVSKPLVSDRVPSEHAGDWLPVLVAGSQDAAVNNDVPVSAMREYRPSERQLAYQENQLGAFIHFGSATYTASMLATPSADTFDPVKLDAEQWVLAAKSFGAQYVVLTVKHHSGFCLWPTQTTKYSVASSPWRGGEGDVVRDFVDACKKHGLRPGLYVSPADKKYACYSTPQPVGTRYLVGDSKAYLDVFTQQLDELLTGYGPIAVVWFDGAHNPFAWDVKDAAGGQRLGTDNGDKVSALVRRHQPDAVISITLNPDVRWSGSESGWAPYPLWNVVPKGQGPSNWVGEDDFGYIPAEANIHTRSTWFWSPGSDQTLASVDRLLGAYDNTIGRGANLLVNMTPDNSGRIPDVEVKRLAKFGAELERQFSKPMGRIDSKSGWQDSTLSIDLEEPQAIDCVVIEEDLSHGQRVIAYAIEVRRGDSWHRVAEGSSVGRKRIERFDSTTTDRLRLRIIKAADVPYIREFAVYRTQK